MHTWLVYISIQRIVVVVGETLLAHINQEEIFFAGRLLCNCEALPQFSINVQNYDIYKSHTIFLQCRV